MKTKRFTIMIFSLTILTVIGLTACQPKEVFVTEEVTVEKTVVVTEEVFITQEVEKLITPTPEPMGPVTISFWHGYNEVEAAKLDEEIIPAFEAAFPNIKVESLNVPYDQFRRKLLTSMAGGTAPDLIRADIIWVPEFADMGALAPLDEVMADFDEYAEAVFPGPLSTNFLNGHYYGLPLDTNTRVMVYNTAMFEAADIENPPGTMEEFLTVCEAIKALGDDKYCFADGGTYAWAVNPWIWSFGGDITDPDITVATGYLNSAETQAAYKFIKDLVDQGYMHPGILGGGVDTWGGFRNDEIAMILEGPWFQPFFGTDKEYGYALMPAGPGGAISVVGGEDIVMFQQSQHKEAAAEFIRFLLSEEIQLELSEVGQMPVIQSVIQSDAIQNHDFYPIFLEQIKTAKARTPHPNWTKIEETYTLAGGSYLLGEMSFEDAFNAASETIDALLPLPE